MKKLLFIFLFVQSTLNIALSQSDWVWQNPLPNNAYHYSVKFVDVNTGWASGYYNDVIKTTDGGVTWQNIFISNEYDYNFYGSVYPVDAQTCFLPDGASNIYKTVNGGSNWTKTTINPQRQLLRAHFLNAQTGWISCDSGKVLYTNNGGSN